MKKTIPILIILLALSSPAFGQKGYLFIESAPESALVTIDGRQSGKYFTPVLCTLSVGEHSIEITKRFYETEILKVKIEPEAVVRKRVDFVKQEKFKVTKPTGMTVEGKYGQLTIITYPHGAEIIADGEKLSMTTPVTMSGVTAGPHRYSIVYHYIQYDTVIIITGDAPQTATIDLKHLEGDDSYSIMPRVTTKVVIVVPGCEYKIDDSGVLLIKGVDAEINIRTRDTSLTLTSQSQLSEIQIKGGNTKHVATESTYIFDPFLDSKLQFDISTLSSKKKFQSREGLAPRHYYHKLPASLNSGKDINVRILVENDGEIVFRYW